MVKSFCNYVICITLFIFLLLLSKKLCSISKVLQIRVNC
ncbi:Hok/Gef family protein [Bacillus subtilis]|nr:Hok/Gef family protein [Bacillus amyloliquefaciens]